MYFEDFSIIRLINVFRLVYTQHQLTYVARAIEGNIWREERRKRGGRKVVCNPGIFPVLNIGWGLSMGYRINHKAINIIINLSFTTMTEYRLF